ncbi:MAG: hypothetical protein H3C47_01695 [Candidatus Cloacimonetes bacterium]|nr:hypothetical protein [Candidatus Cloacimonadota bacterium]
MSFANKITVLILNFLILGGFYLLASTFLAEDLKFEFLKFFVFFLPFYFILDGIKTYFSTRYEQRVLIYLRKLALADGKDVEEIKENDPLHDFYLHFLAVLDKLLKPAERPNQIRDLPIPSIHRILADPNKRFRQKASDYLQAIKLMTPNSELFLFGVSKDRIHLIEFEGTEEISRAKLTQMANWSMPFSWRSDFSGRCYSDGQPILTNELKSDPNLGQFLSESNPNLPIYGAIFPLGVAGDMRGFLWIRDGAQALETMEIQKEQYLFATRLLYDHLQTRSQFLSFDKPNFEDVYLHFESQSRLMIQMARTQKVPVSMILFFLKVSDTQKMGPALDRLIDLIQTHLPPMSTITREFNLINCCVYGPQRDVVLLQTARVVHSMAHWLNTGHDSEKTFTLPPKPAIGEMYTGMVHRIPEQLTFDNLLDKAREALKTAIAAGPNLIRSI